MAAPAPAPAPAQQPPPPAVRVGVGVFVLASRSESPSNPRFLVGKRKGSHGAGSYALPGGHLEFGETPELCAAREVLEETGLVVDPGKVRFLTATNDIMPRDGKHYITLFVVCEREDEGEEARTLEPHKCEGWEWASWEDLLGWVKLELEEGDDDGEGGVKYEGRRRLFTPMISLVQQRPGAVPANA